MAKEDRTSDAGAGFGGHKQMGGLPAARVATLIANGGDRKPCSVCNFVTIGSNECDDHSQISCSNIVTDVIPSALGCVDTLKVLVQIKQQKTDAH